MKRSGVAAKAVQQRPGDEAARHCQRIVARQSSAGRKQPHRGVAEQFGREADTTEALMDAPGIPLADASGWAERGADW